MCCARPRSWNLWAPPSGVSASLRHGGFWTHVDGRGSGLCVPRSGRTLDAGPPIPWKLEPGTRQRVPSIADLSHSSFKRRPLCRSSSPLQRYNSSNTCAQIREHPEEAARPWGFLDLRRWQWSRGDRGPRPAQPPPLRGAARPVACGWGRAIMMSYLGRCDIIVPRAWSFVIAAACASGVSSGGGPHRPPSVEPRPGDYGRGVLRHRPTDASSVASAYARMNQGTRVRGVPPPRPFPPYNNNPLAKCAYENRERAERTPVHGRFWTYLDGRRTVATDGFPPGTAAPGCAERRALSRAVSNVR
jgi:hypothetical protein